MKFDKKKVFAPILITLETPEEISAMYTVSGSIGGDYNHPIRILFAEIFNQLDKEGVEENINYFVDVDTSMIIDPQQK